MGRIFVMELEGRAYRCKFCKTHLALADDLVSRVHYFWEIMHESLKLWWWVSSRTDKWDCGPPLAAIAEGCHRKEWNAASLLLTVTAVAFQAYPWATTLQCPPTAIPVNITVGAHEERMMLSGMHTVADIFCCCCGQIEAAHERSQKYKEGKFVLERGRIIDGVDSEYYIDTHPSMSDAEDA